jgi:hypothetical protein
MFDGIDENRVLNMTDREKRWFDNIKKAFYESDRAIQSGTPEDRSLEELFKAIDTAKTLRQSLRGEEISRFPHRNKFIEFLALDFPLIPKVVHGFIRTETANQEEYTFGGIIYEIRCMVHENENLNAAENVDYRILLDWSVRNPVGFAETRDGRFVCNGFFLWNQLRRILAKFITGIEGVISPDEKESFSIMINPKIESIRPKKDR